MIALSTNEFSQRMGLVPPGAELAGSDFTTVVDLARQFAPKAAGLERMESQREMARWLPEFRYPLGDFLYLLYEGARLAMPRLGRMDAFFEAVGEVVALRYREGTVGKLAFSMFEGKDPIAILAQMPATYATRQTHGGRVFRRISEVEGQLMLVDDPLPPGYHLGLIRTFVTFNGAPALATAEARSLTSCTYRVVWQKAAEG